MQNKQGIFSRARRKAFLNHKLHYSAECSAALQRPLRSKTGRSLALYPHHDAVFVFNNGVHTAVTERCDESLHVTRISVSFEAFSLQLTPVSSFCDGRREPPFPSLDRVRKRQEEMGEKRQTGTKGTERRCSGSTSNGRLGGMPSTRNRPRLSSGYSTVKRMQGRQSRYVWEDR